MLFFSVLHFSETFNSYSCLLPCARFEERVASHLPTAAGEGQTNEVKWRGWWAGHPGLLQSSSSVFKDLKDVLEPFSKTNTYKRITSLHVLLASKGFVVVSKSQQTRFFLKCLPLSAMDLGKNDFSNASDKSCHCWVLVLSPYASHVLSGTICRKTSSSAVCWPGSLN